MVDHLTPEKRSACMASIRSANTRPEILVRKMIHSMGYRYRLHRRDLPGKPDMVFPKYKKIIFIHGCFWHWHECKHIPKSNVEFWRKKLEMNKRRDECVRQELSALGWDTMTIWECSIKKPDLLRSRLTQFLKGM